MHSGYYIIQELAFKTMVAGWIEYEKILSRSTVFDTWPWSLKLFPKKIRKSGWSQHNVESFLSKFISKNRSRSCVLCGNPATFGTLVCFLRAAQAMPFVFPARISSTIFSRMNEISAPAIWHFCLSNSKNPESSFQSLQAVLKSQSWREKFRLMRGGVPNHS